MSIVLNLIDISYSNIKTKNLIKKIAIEFENICKKEISQAKVLDIISYYSYLKNEKNLKESTIKNKMDYISSIFSKMLSYELIEVNPYIKAKNNLPKMSVQYFPDIEKRIEEENIDNTILYISNIKKDKYFSCALKVLKYTGLRIFELAQAEKQNLKEDNFGNYKLSFIGKGNKGRVVFIPRFLVQEIYELENNTKYLLTNKNGCQIDYSHFSQYLLRYSKKAIGISFSAHKVRSFFATNLLEKGIELNEISKLLGHSSVDITARYYLRTKSDSRKILNLFKKI